MKNKTKQLQPAKPAKPTADEIEAAFDADIAALRASLCRSMGAGRLWHGMGLQ